MSPLALPPHKRRNERNSRRAWRDCTRQRVAALLLMRSPVARCCATELSTRRWRAGHELSRLLRLPRTQRATTRTAWVHNSPESRMTEPPRDRVATPGHVTDETHNCWCQPRFYLPCDECENGCYRCDKGLIELTGDQIDAADAALVVVHNDIPWPGPNVRQVRPHTPGWKI
jgi:hypothetical protein